MLSSSCYVMVKLDSNQMKYDSTFAVTFGDPSPVNFYIPAFYVKHTRIYQVLLAPLH